MLTQLQPSNNLPPDSLKSRPRASLSAQKTRKITRRIRKTREKFRPTKSSSLNDSASRTLLRKTNNLLSLKNDRTPQKTRKETKETESGKCELEEATLQIVRNHKAQLLAFGFFAEKNLQTYLHKEIRFSPQNFLERHKISGKLRSKMVDWLIEVSKSFDFSDVTFFLTLNLMDRYFAAETRELETKDIHLIGVTCLFIAMKSEENCPIKLEVVASKIAHSKLTPSQILSMEVQILEALDFDLFGPNLLSFIEIVLVNLKFHEILDERTFDVLVQLVIYNAMMVMYEYSIISKFNHSLLAASITLVAFKLLQKITPGFNLGVYNTKIKSLLQLEERLILEAANQILLLARNFDSIYGASNNLKKYSGELFAELERFKEVKE